MEPKKSIRDISSTNNISDIVAEQTIPTNIIKKNKKIEVNPPEEDFSPTLSSSRGGIRFPKVKLTYIIAFLIIVVLLIVLIFVPNNKSTDPVEQAKKESEIVKKQLSKHMILPQDEQIDIRKITSKVEDPFFQNAEIGDYLIIFYKNRIAYIFSLEKDIIVNAGVVFIDPKTATTTSTTSNSQTQ